MLCGIIFKLYGVFEMRHLSLWNLEFVICNKLQRLCCREVFK